MEKKNQKKETGDSKDFYVYRISVNGKARYIGFTDNLKRRQGQHIKGIEKGEKKQLYQKIRELEVEPEITFEIVRTFKHKGDAKRFEAFLILGDYFNGRELWQSFPIIIKYF